MTRELNSTRPKIIAEIGCNHAGSLAAAEKMISVAAHFCEVDVVKFQKRDSRTLLTEEQYNAPHPNLAHAYGETYGEHREFLEFDVDQHEALTLAAAREGISYSTSVWDVPSARAIIPLAPEFLKVPSAVNTNSELMDTLATEYEGQIHVSFGMTDREEEERIVARLQELGRLDSTVLYACTSGYPVAFQDICLGEVVRLKETYGGDVAAIGFSGHHLGIAADIAAQALGAQWIERHFTLDRTMRGTDHAASLEPDGMRRLARDTKAVAKALAYKSSDILPVEQVQRAKLKWLREGVA